MKSAFVFLILIATWASAEDVTMQDLIKRGEYISHAADCVACHTPAGQSPYSGGLKLSTPFGDLFTPNITPDEETGIGRWNLDQFKRAVRTGVGINGEHLFPAFPYDSYTLMPDEDVEALYAFMRTIRPVKNKVEVNQLSFPFSVRQGIYFWKLLYFKEGRFKPNPEQSDEWNRGAYLVEGPGHCGSCHTPRTLIGGPNLSKKFTGAQVENWFAANLTSDLIKGIGDWSIEELVEFFKTGISRDRSTALGPMAEVQQSLKHLSDADLRAIAVYLKSLPPQPGSDPLSNSRLIAAQKQQGLLYLENCAGCHHPLGLGRKGRVPTLAGNSTLRGPPSNILNVVLFGIPERPPLEGMPAFADRLSDEELARIINYVRSRWGQSDEPVRPQEVREWRARAP